MDANSLNGIHVNGHKLRPFTPYILQAGDVVQFAVSDSNKGEFEYIFYLASKKQLKRQNDEIVLNELLENEAKLNENNQAVLFDSQEDTLFAKKRQVFGTSYLDPVVLIQKLNEIQDERTLTDLQTLKTKEEVILDIVNFMNMELQCSICEELLVQAATLNCSHTFCKVCITQWMQVKDECPDCHTSITSLTRVVALDNCMDKIMRQLGGRMKQLGADLISARQSEQSLLDGTVANSSLAVRESRRQELADSITRATTFQRKATLKSTAARRAASVQSKAFTKTLMLIRAAELTRSAALRKTQAAMRSAPMVKAAKVAQAATLTRKVIERRISTLSRASAKSVAIASVGYIPLTTSANTLATTEGAVTELIDNSNASSSSENNSGSYTSNDEQEMSANSSSDIDEGSSNSNMLSEDSMLSDDSQDDIENNLSRLRKGSRSSLNDGVKPIGDDDKTG